ncbi:GNAT family N-acetyltransferase [Alicyclobacillus fodiniaquatilis]|jgi:RimJ/RimL family protein N-acetyltransferase|uniref:GNAT family N-acetyltransferase n=1 Tax=Alicyclobacillus fodiniaquatilis TaxID=1661150 RepID=A0ABW4JF49_9BACL
MTAIHLRPVNWADRHHLRMWRNDPVTRANSLSHDVVSQQEHEAWLAASLAMPNRKLVMIERASTPVGVLRFDAAGHGKIEVSINIAPTARGQGVGRRALARCTSLALQYWPEAAELFARILPGNDASLRAFQRAGFVGDKGADRACDEQCDAAPYVVLRLRL